MGLTGFSLLSNAINLLRGAYEIQAPFPVYFSALKPFNFSENRVLEFKRNVSLN